MLIVLIEYDILEHKMLIVLIEYDILEHKMLEYDWTYFDIINMILSPRILCQIMLDIVLFHTISYYIVLHRIT